MQRLIFFEALIYFRSGLCCKVTEPYAVRRSPGFSVVPRQQFVDLGLLVPARNVCEHTTQISVWLDSIEFAGLDQGDDDGPVLCASVVRGGRGNSGQSLRWIG